MKKTISLIIILSFVLIGLGCEGTKSKAVEGSVVGGVVGAGAGAIIGSVMGKAGVGAGIGAAVGAVSGGLIGSQIEKKPQAETTPQQAAQTVTTEQMSVLQIIELTQQGTPDDIIIDKIKKTNSKFNLSAEDINYLQKQRISQKVIDAMMAK
ncbi:MAG: glycine zipper domain-containing protein [Candidatus Omnitrophota bacterium]